MKETDRPPFNIEACPEIWGQLKDYFNAASNDEVCEKLGVDFRRIYGIKAPEKYQHPDENGRISNIWGVKQFPDQSFYLPSAIAPLGNAEKPDDIENHNWPKPDEMDFSEAAEECAEHYKKNITFGGWWSPFFHTAGMMLGYEKFMMSFCLYPDMLRCLFDRIVEIDLQINRQFLQKMQGRLDILYVGNDFGTQRSLTISKDFFRIWIVPYIKKYVSLAHEFNVLLMQHSCGAIDPIIPLLIDCRIDILDPIQVNAAGMNFKDLVDKYQGKIAFHGGIDTQDLLINASPAEITQTVNQQIDIAKGKLPYIVCGSQNYTKDTPLENILAVYETSMSIP